MADDSLNERLKRYEDLLREKGIDPDQAVNGLENEHEPHDSRAKSHETVWQIPTPASTVSGPQETIFKPRILRVGASLRP